VRIDLPPLRDRGDDVGLLAEFFANRAAQEMGKPVSGLSIDAYQVLKTYHWPGNVRELENLIQRACVLASGNVILGSDLPFDQASRNESERVILERAAKRFLQSAALAKVSPVALATKMLAETALRETGDEAKAAAILGISKDEFLAYVETRSSGSEPAAPAKKGKAAVRGPARSAVE
jgi:DNA-binding NtrC family response regulator